MQILLFKHWLIIQHPLFLTTSDRSRSFPLQWPRDRRITWIHHHVQKFHLLLATEWANLLLVSALKLTLTIRLLFFFSFFFHDESKAMNLLFVISFSCITFFFYFKKRFDYLSLQLQYDVEFPQITSTKIFHTTISATTRYY